MTVSTIDPERYQNAADCVGVEEAVLREVHRQAEEMLGWIGGHKRAERMKRAQRLVHEELLSRKS